MKNHCHYNCKKQSPDFQCRWVSMANEWTYSRNANHCIDGFLLRCELQRQWVWICEFDHASKSAKQMSHYPLVHVQMQCNADQIASCKVAKNWILWLQEKQKEFWRLSQKTTRASTRSMFWLHNTGLKCKWHMSDNPASRHNNARIKLQALSKPARSHLGP